MSSTNITEVYSDQRASTVNTVGIGELRLGEEVTQRFSCRILGLGNFYIVRSSEPGITVPGLVVVPSWSVCG